MKAVLDALTAYERELQGKAEAGEFGSSESSLLQNLDRVIARNRTVFYIIIGMLVAAFILAIVFIWYWRENPTALAGVFAATGITVPWAISTITGLWKEISKAETLHVLVAHTNDETAIRNIVNIISENLYGGAKEA